MTEVLHANIFFFIASVGVVLFIFFVCVALYHIIKVIRSIRRIVERIEAGSETVASDLAELRTMLNPKRLFSVLLSIAGIGSTKRSRRRKTDEEDAD